jgi:hypothetical protein
MCSTSHRIAACTFVLAALASGPIRAQAADDIITIVYPTGHFPDDVENVQTAVEMGGIVVLKARDIANVPTSFNFGPPAQGSGSVFLTKEVTINGETVAGHMTTVTGGDGPFQIYDLVRVAFHRVSFEGPRGTAVFSLVTQGSSSPIRVCPT